MHLINQITQRNQAGNQITHLTSDLILEAWLEVFIKDRKNLEFNKQVNVLCGLI